MGLSDVAFRRGLMILEVNYQLRIAKIVLFYFSRISFETQTAAKLNNATHIRL